MFALFAALAVPLAAGSILAIRKKAGKAVLLGAACFLTFQVLTRLPLLQVVLPQSAGFVLFQSTHPLLYLSLLALSAGVFEECGRYLTMRLFLRNSRLTDGVAFGVGHGGLEAVLLVGVNLILLPWGVGGGALSSQQLFLAGLERLLAMTAHVCWSVMVWRSLRERRVLLLPAAVLLHGLYDFLPVFLLQNGAGALAAEGALALLTGALLLCSLLANRRKEKAQTQNEKEIKS